MKDNLDNIFENLKNQFDIEEPAIGHFNRFEVRLGKLENTSKRNPFFTASMIAIAASFLLFFGIWIGTSFSNKGMELANVSSEMEETQSYFVNTIQKELQTIETERNNDTEVLINDAFLQLNKLENQYNTLTLELKESTEDKRIIYAMISNFQQRVEILQSLLLQIENVKQLKTQTHEKYV